MARYFTDATFNEQDHALLALAARSAGPDNNTSKMRREAANRRLGPDKWCNNVEIVTAEKIGIETTTYVRNIFKYYVSYRLTQDAGERAGKLKDSVIRTR